MSNDAPIVTVVCITYGHEEFISQALDSFLMQKTTFPYQILVGEDKGSDRTAEIVMEYAEKYPDKIIPFIREENMGAQRNLIDLCRRAGTEYIALCEGDDYWIDDHKLQKQYDFMEEHKEYRACFHNTRIQADASWYLYNWYIKDENGDISIPESIPGYDTSLREMRMDYYIEYGPAHTSSIFYRWDNEREIPEWYYNHLYGDHSLMMIQVGDGRIGYIPETMSVYRRSDAGILMFESRTHHFLKSRESWIEMAVDLENHFKRNYGGFARDNIKKRIVKEFNNYIYSIIDSGDEEALKEAYTKFPYPAKLAFLDADDIRKEQTALKNIYTEKGISLLKNDNDIRKIITSEINQREELNMNRLLRRVANYTKAAEIPKDPTLWVFSMEGRVAYANNVRHLYEYILAYHPEIRPVWITKNGNLFKLAEAENLPVYKIGTKKCSKMMKRAAIAVVDKYKTQAYIVNGFNAATKVVRLGRGVSLFDFSKDPAFALNPALDPMATVADVFNYKADKYPDIKNIEMDESYLMEDYSNTFLQIAPNAVAADVYRTKFGVPEENIFVCGSPRSYPVADRTDYKNRKILLYPDRRADEILNEKYYYNFYDNLEYINQELSDRNIFLDVYINNISNINNRKLVARRLDMYSNIDIMRTSDAFHDLVHYDLMITDYADIMFDYILQDKPVVIFAPDKERALQDMTLLYDFDTTVPGTQASDWIEIFDIIDKAIVNIDYDKDKREHAKSVVYDMSVNDEDNSERIVNEIKRRLGM